MKATRPGTGRLRGLRQLLVMLREHGVTEYESGPVRLKLGAAPRPAVEAKAPAREAKLTSDQAAAQQMLRRVGLSEDAALDLAASMNVGD